MTMFARLVLILSLAVSPGLAQAADPEEISWDTLAPPRLSDREPVREPDRRTNGHPAPDPAVRGRAERSDDADRRAEAQALREQLEEEGLDVDGLFAARLAIMEKAKRRPPAVNEALIGSRVRLPGYVLPLEFKDRKVVEFLLVPTVGACIHTPPPPANQIVHVVYPDGIEVNGLFTPVWITGTMAAERSEQNVGFSDGRARVSVSYTMRPDLVQKYGK